MQLVEYLGEKFESIESRMATKEDLKGFATKEDIQNLGDRIDGLSSEMRLMRGEVEDVKRELERLSSEIGTMSEVYTKEIDLLKKRVAKLEDQIVILMKSK
jgi:archaellum component FlaC